MTDPSPAKSDTRNTSPNTQQLQLLQSPAQSLVVEHAVPAQQKDTTGPDHRAPSMGQLSMYSGKEEFNIEKRSTVSQPAIPRVSSLENGSQTELDTISMMDLNRKFSEPTVLKSMAGRRHKVTKCQHCVSPVLEKKSSHGSLASSEGSWDSRRVPKDSSGLTEETTKTILDTNRIAHTFRTIACQTDYSWLKHAKRIFMPPAGTPFQPSLERVGSVRKRSSGSSTVSWSDSVVGSSSSSSSQLTEVSSTTSLDQLAVSGRRRSRKSKSRKRSSSSKKGKYSKHLRRQRHKKQPTPEIMITDSKQDVVEEESKLADEVLSNEEIESLWADKKSPAGSAGSSRTSSKYRPKNIMNMVKTVRRFRLTLTELQEAANALAKVQTGSEEEQQLEATLLKNAWKGWRAEPGKDFVESPQSSDDGELADEDRKMKKAHSVAMKAKRLRLTFEQLIAASEDTTGRKCDVLINIFDSTGQLAGSAIPDDHWSHSLSSSTTAKSFSTASEADDVEVEVATTLPDDENFVKYQEQLFWRGGGVFEGECEYCGQPIKPFPTKEQVSRRTPSQLYCCLHYRDFIYSMIHNPVEQWILHHDAMIDVHKHDHYDSGKQMFDASYYSKLAQRRSGSPKDVTKSRRLGLATAPRVVHKAAASRVKSVSGAQLSTDEAEPVHWSTTDKVGLYVTTTDQLMTEDKPSHLMRSDITTDTSSNKFVKATARMHKREIIRHKKAFELGPTRSPEIGKNFLAAKGKPTPSSQVKFSLLKDWLVKTPVLEPMDAEKVITPSMISPKAAKKLVMKLPSWVQFDDSDEEISSDHEVATETEPKIESKTVGKADKKTGRQTEPKTESKTEPKTGRKTESKTEPKPDLKTESKAQRRQTSRKLSKAIGDLEVGKEKIEIAKRSQDKKSSIMYVDGKLPSTLAKSSAKLRGAAESRSLMISEKGSIAEASQSKVESAHRVSKTQVQPAKVSDKVEIDLSSLEPLAIQITRNMIYKYYKNGNIFAMLFPNGTGNIFYPDGKISVSIVRFSRGVYGYFVNTVTGQLIAVLDNIGRTSVDYEETGKIRLCLTQHGGLVLKSTGARKQRWLWHAQGATHVHAPPIQPMTLTVTKHVELRVEGQDTITLTFRCLDRCVRFQTGALLEIKSSSTELNNYEQFLHIHKAKIQGVFNQIARLLRYPRPPKLEMIRSPLELKAQTAKVKELRKAVRPELLPKCAILWR